MKIYFTISFLIISIFVFAQKEKKTPKAKEPQANTYMATFKDGEEITYTVLEDKTNQMHKFNLSLGREYNGILQNVPFAIRTSYFIPDKMLISAEGMFGSNTTAFEITDLYFLTSSEKDKNQRITLKSRYVGGNVTEIHVSKAPLKRKVYLGIHGGYAFSHFNTLSYSEIIIGGGLLKAKHIKVNIEKKGIKQGTSQFGLYADALLYVGGHNSNITDNSNLSPTSSFGFRAYMTGKSSVWGSKDWGIFYRLGAELNILSTISPLFGLGIYAGF